MYERSTKKGAITFKRWKRKSWAAFASLGKVIRIGVISVTFSLLTIKSMPALAQSKQKSANETLLALEELVINTERPTPFQPLVRVVAVIQQKDIERAAVQNIQDLLRYIQGADLRSRGSEGVQADLNILGGTFDQTLVMINGINFTDPQTGHHSLNIPVDISQIERIELLHGPGAWSDGGIAYSGAVNIITKRATKREILSTISGGDYGYFRASANLAFAHNRDNQNSWRVSGQAGGSISRSDGYTKNTDFGIANIYSNLHLSNGKGHTIELQAGYQQKEFGANSFYSISFPEQFENTRLFLSSVRYTWESERWQLSGTAYQRRHHDRFELFRNESPDWYKSHNYHMNDIAGFNAKAAYRWGKWGSTVLGADYRYEHIYSTVLGRGIEKSVKVPGEEGIYFTKSLGREIPALYARHILQLKRWRFTAGVMGADSKLYTGIAAAFAINPYTEVNGWVNNSYRNPTFTDLYYKSPTQTGNSTLKPEEAIATQLGVRYTKHNIRASLSGFYRHGYNIIDWVRESGSDQWQASNITNVTSVGADIYLAVTLAGSAVNRIAISYSWMDVIKESSGKHSLYATDFLRHKAALFLEHKIISKLSGRWDLSYQKRDGTYMGAQNTEIPYKGFVITDLKLIWEEGKIRPFAEATNLFNTDYLHIGNLPQPKRWIKAGINIVL